MSEGGWPEDDLQRPEGRYMLFQLLLVLVALAIGVLAGYEAGLREARLNQFQGRRP